MNPNCGCLQKLCEVRKLLEKRIDYAATPKISVMNIKLTQPDEEKRKHLRDVYGNDAMMLIAVGQTVATEFATIAAANNYWKNSEV